ncbi:MAG: exodeoxyribonuclease VII large subunit [Tistlia sp.]|uniref:exodeoxyribonuclease VII large subunit n=1 Tax=Tistlia sp. TaxID=3057121 RepID=UPI0034A49059
MTDLDLPLPDAGPGNLPELSVSEVSRAIKRTLEDRFERVRVRGEISGFKRAASGHLYLCLKDAEAALDAVCWKGTAGRLQLRPEDGMEVIATGRITTFPGRSKYQLVIDSLELAGEGALLKLLDDRRRKLAEEGLFDAERKRPLPYLPSVIGVVTSPTGAVIRDILHRLADRFPRHVLVWPVLVQGEGAAEQIARAIRGFNALAADGAVPRPDLLIVARGGGSLEDLWAFNEEVVVRAAAESAIPLISAVGHETDTTLIDFASDRRAPTPTAAAEIAVPVRGELVATLLELEHRKLGAAQRLMTERRTAVESLGRGLPDPVRLLGEKSQALDERSERLALAWRGFLQQRAARASELGAHLPHPRQQIAFAQRGIGELAARLAGLGPRMTLPARRALAEVEAGRRLPLCAKRMTEKAGDALEAWSARLETVSYEKTLIRGFAVVRDASGHVVARADQVSPGEALEIQFADARRDVVAGGGAPRRKATPPAPKQPDLF